MKAVKNLYSKGYIPNNFVINCEEIPEGLVGFGGSLSVDILVEAYSKGIFPWYSNEPIQWFSPNQRMVLFPKNLHISKSFSKWLKTKLNMYTLKIDTCFEKVIQTCATIKRNHQDGTTWITKNMQAAYIQLFKQNLAHSLEIFSKRTNQLVGGLYGISLGKAFFGESMFSKQSNTSKLALYFLCKLMIYLDFHYIDCQLYNDHLFSMGAKEIPKKDFLQLLSKSNNFFTNNQKWSKYSTLISSANLSANTS